MVIKLKQAFRTQLLLYCFALASAQMVLAQNEGKNSVRNNLVNGGIVKSDKLSKQSESTHEKTQQVGGLSISSAGDILNTKSVDVSGSVKMNAGKSITNGSKTAPASIKASSSVTLNAPTIHNSGTISAGSGNVNISTTNLINSGSITAKTGDVNISNHNGNSLLIDNANGSIAGKTVTFEVNDSHKSKTLLDQSGKINVHGGTVSGDTINIGGNDTNVNVDAVKINGKLNVPASSAVVRSNQTSE